MVHATVVIWEGIYSYDSNQLAVKSGVEKAPEVSGSYFWVQGTTRWVRDVYNSVLDNQKTGPT